MSSVTSPRPHAHSRSMSSASFASSSPGAGAGIKHELDPLDPLDGPDGPDDPAQVNLTPSNKRPKPMSAERIARLEARQARNRASAQASRDKKKAFFNRLEVEHRVLVQENHWLKQQNQHLCSTLMDFEKRLQMAEGVIDVLTNHNNSNNAATAPASASTSPNSGINGNKSSPGMTLAQAQAIAHTQIGHSPTSSISLGSPESHHLQRSLSLPQAPSHVQPLGRAFPPSLHGALPSNNGLSSITALVTPPSAPAMTQATPFAPMASGYPFPPMPGEPHQHQQHQQDTPTSVSPGDLTAPALSPGSSPAQRVSAAAPAQLMTGSISSSSISSLGDATVVGDWGDYGSPSHDVDDRKSLESLLSAHAAQSGSPEHGHAPGNPAASSLGTAFTVSMRKPLFLNDASNSPAFRPAFNTPLSAALD